MNEDKFKRFGKITLLGIDIDCGYVRICNEDDYTNNIIVNIDEIKCIDTLSSIYGYVFLITGNKKLYYRDGYLEIGNGFGTMIFNKKDVDDFSSYIEKEYAYE